MDSDLEKIYSATIKFLTPLTTEETYATVAQEAVKLVGGDDAAIVILSGDILKPVYGTSEQAAGFMPRKRGYAYRSFKEQRAYVINKDDIERVYPSSTNQGLHSVLFIPLSYRNKAMGVLAVRSYSENKKFTHHQLDILKLFGSMASMAIDKIKMYEEISKTLDSRDQFIAIAAHELRTPLTSINGYAQLLHSRFAEISSPEARWIQEMHIQCQRLTNLINELLMFNLIASHKLHFTWGTHSISQIVNRVVKGFQTVYPDRTIHVEEQLSNLGDEIVCDIDKMSMVLSSLLENALKFSSEDSAVFVNIKVKDPFTVIEIKDTGVGIPQKNIHRIFEGFYKGQDNHRTGMGVGLFSAKYILDQHRGSIRVKSKVNKGTTVQVKIPKTNL